MRQNVNDDVCKDLPKHSSYRNVCYISSIFFGLLDARRITKQFPFFSLQLGFEKACLEAHNDLRAFHGSPALKWSAKLTRAAQSWANHLAATDKFEHDLVALDQGQGENLYYKTFPKRLCGYGEQGADCTSCGEIVQMWYDEEADYDYQTGKAKKIGRPVLHFTQLVWKATRELGMATAVANNRLVAVARYTPRGNWGGQFQENVLKPNIL